MTIGAVNKDKKAEESFADNHFYNIWRFLMVEQISLLPQVKQTVVVSNKLVYTSCFTSC